MAPAGNQTTAPSGDVTKLVECSRALAEVAPPKRRQRALALTKWLREELGAGAQVLGDECEASLALRVLDVHKQDVTRAQRHFVKHFRMRSEEGCRELFHDRSAESEEILTSCQNVYMFSIPRLTTEGHRINYMKLVPGVSLENFDPKALFKRFFMVSDIRFKEDVECKGDIFLVDLSGFTYSHAVKLFNSGLLSKFVKCLKDTYPRRLEALHFVNVKCWHRRAIKLALRVSKAGKKVNKKIGTHAANEGDKEAAAMGGVDGMDRVAEVFQDHNDLWTKKLISYSSWFESQEAAHRAFVPRKTKSPRDAKKKHSDSKDKDRHHHQDKTTNGEVFTFLELEGAFRQMEADEAEGR